MSTLNQTTISNRIHICVFGKRNSGKSSLVNALTRQNTSLVSDYAGTTTDPVYKSIEFYPLGACVFVDTAGFDDEGELGLKRVEKSLDVLNKADLALVVVSSDQTDFALEQEWIDKLTEKKIPFVVVMNKLDLSESDALFFKENNAIKISAKDNIGIDDLRKAIIDAFPADSLNLSLTKEFLTDGDHVLLVMPQDINAPKGRLILPQVQTIRDLLDNKGIVTCVTMDKLEECLKLFVAPPKLIITDSQVFKKVHEICPKESVLTSFSILMARYKGDIDEFVLGADKVDKLKEDDNVLILEACTHNPLDGDIGRVQIPQMLRKKVGEKLNVEVMSGNNMPKDISKYALIIHCGACMFNRAYVLSRVAIAKENNVPITNYGIVIAKLNGILDKVSY